MMHKQSMTRNCPNLKRSLRNVLPMKKGNYWKKLQNFLQVQTLGRRNWSNLLLLAFRRVQRDSTSSVKVEWSSYMEKAETHYLEDMLLSKVERKTWRGLFRNVRK